LFFYIVLDFSTHVIDGGGVTIMFLEIGKHGFNDRFPYGRCGCMIQIDPFHKRPPYLVPERKLENFFKFKEGENFNHRNTLKYFED